MAVATSAQSFTTSGGFWTGITTIVSLLISLAATFGFKLTTEQTSILMSLLGTVGAVVAMIYRARADQPWTLNTAAPALPPAPPAVVATETAAAITAAGAGK